MWKATGFQTVSSVIREFCQFDVVYEGQENKWTPFLLLGTLWLDSALFFGLKIEKDHVYAVVLFSLPLIAFYLLQFNQTFIRILGLLALSLCVVMPFYLKDSVRG
jgi:hypothetical protein